MFLRSIAVGAVAAGLVALLPAAPARAETFDKLTYLTFSGPVKIPGATLTPGTYRFHLTNPTTSRNVMQVLSRDGGIVYSQFHTIPDVRQTTTDESAVTFNETSADAPPPIHSLFYGGERSGYEFVYPKEPILAAAAAEVAPPAHVEAPQQIAQNVSPAPAVTKPVSTLNVTPTPQRASPSTAVKQALPKTASSLPLVALMGFASLLLGFVVRAARQVA